LRDLRGGTGSVAQPGAERAFREKLRGIGEGDALVVKIERAADGMELGDVVPKNIEVGEEGFLFVGGASG